MVSLKCFNILPTYFSLNLAKKLINMENEKTGLHTAIIEVMKEVKNIEKNLTVGSGKSSYKGVSDKDVKYQIGQSMAKHGLTCLMINIDQNMKIDRWVENDQYGEKTKQSVFTEVKCTFLLTHAQSGENVTIQGYGHGVDSQDKSAGKATTYALKNALLYTFLVPTGSIDDTDNTHSEQQPTPQPQQQPAPPQQQPIPQPKKVNESTLDQMCIKILSGERTAEQLVSNKKFSFTQEQIEKLMYEQEIFNKGNNE